MLRRLIGRFRAKPVSSAPAETTISPQKAFVEEIWSSWRYERKAPHPANPAERVSQLKRLGENEEALKVALAEIEIEERGERRIAGRQTVPWYYWEAAILYRRLKRYDEEVALIRRFARNHKIHFRTFSKRHQSMSGAHETWAAKFLERLEKAKAAGGGQNKH